MDIFARTRSSLSLFGQHRHRCRRSRCLDQSWGESRKKRKAVEQSWVRWREPPWRSSACLRGNYAATGANNALALRATIMTTVEKTLSQLPLGMIPSFSQAVIRPQCCMCTEHRANKTCLSRRSVIAPAAHNAGCTTANQHRAGDTWRAPLLHGPIETVALVG